MQFLKKNKNHKVIECGMQAKHCPCGFTKREIVNALLSDNFKAFRIEATIAELYKLKRVDRVLYKGYVIYWMC